MFSTSDLLKSTKQNSSYRAGILSFMKNDDARKTPDSLYERRKQVVRLFQKGYGPMKVAKLAGLSRGAVNAA